MPIATGVHNHQTEIRRTANGRLKSAGRVFTVDHLIVDGDTL